jgi:Leucine-rich repeat (LRR) protein
LNVSKNQLEGVTFGDQLQSAVLKSVDLSSNNLGATFNISSLMGLTNVQHLRLASCSIKSKLPDTINALQSLVTLDFNSNMLTGTIPTTLGTITTLETVLLASNELTGTIPSELAQIQNMKVLELQSNLLTGAVPAELASFPGLSFNYSGNSIQE